MLLNHLIENWSDSSLSKSWISKTDNSLEVRSSEDGVLSFDITELLIFDVNLSA
jgi:hypothetical protein